MPPEATPSCDSARCNALHRLAAAAATAIRPAQVLPAERQLLLQLLLAPKLPCSAVISAIQTTSEGARDRPPAAGAPAQVLPVVQLLSRQLRACCKARCSSARRS